LAPDGSNDPIGRQSSRTKRFEKGAPGCIIHNQELGMDRLTSMEIFVRVAEAGSFAAVAGRRSISATMVGKHIAALEERLGGRLLHRTTRRQSLTDLGREYYQASKQILAQVAEADAGATALTTTPRGLLRVNAPVSLGTSILAPALAEYLARCPEVDVELHLDDRVVDLAEEGYDAAIRIGPLADSRLVARPLGPYRLIPCASPAYLAAHGTPRRPRDLAEHNCLGFTHWAEGDEWPFVGPTGEERIAVKGRLRASNGQALRMAALRGLGIILQPEPLLAEDLASGSLVRLLPAFQGPSRPMHLVFLQQRRLTPKVRSFIEFVVAHLGKRTVTAKPRRHKSGL
jgi:DNA-binding transcriptional LysR family regulator